MTSPVKDHTILASDAVRTTAAVIIVIASSIFTSGFLLYLQRPPPPRYYYGLAITEVRYAALQPGQVVFGLDNSGSSSDITITQVLAQGAGINGTTSTSSNTTIPAGATTFLTVTFWNVSFQIGARYDFTLISSAGNKYPTSAVR